jgi:hypothetical protein
MPHLIVITLAIFNKCFNWLKKDDWSFWLEVSFVFVHFDLIFHLIKHHCPFWPKWTIFLSNLIICPSWQIISIQSLPFVFTSHTIMEKWRSICLIMASIILLYFKTIKSIWKWTSTTSMLESKSYFLASMNIIISKWS